MISSFQVYSTTIPCLCMKNDHSYVQLISIAIHSLKKCFFSGWELAISTLLPIFRFFSPFAHQISNQFRYLYIFTTFLWVNVSVVCFFHPFTFSLSVYFYFKCTVISSTSDALSYTFIAHLLLGLCSCGQPHATAVRGHSLGTFDFLPGTHTSTVWKYGEGNMPGGSSWPVGDSG